MVWVVCCAAVGLNTHTCTRGRVGSLGAGEQPACIVVHLFTSLLVQLVEQRSELREHVDALLPPLLAVAAYEPATIVQQLASSQSVHAHTCTCTHTDTDITKKLK